MPRIKAAICHEFGQPLVIENVNLRAPGANEVEVTLSACAICHSDISYAQGAWGGPLPAIFGHEAAGHISAIGSGVTGFETGQSVIATLIRNCGACSPCTSGAPCYCQAPGRANPPAISDQTGNPVEQGMLIGAFAERVVVDVSQIAPIPATMPMDAASLLSCGVITGVGAVVNSANVRPGEIVTVIGAGGVGLNAIQGARIAGASRIIAVDMTPEKLSIAREFGATDGVLATDPTPWKTARKIAGRAADAVLVTVGAIPAYDTATRYLGPQGRLVMVGMPHGGEKSTYEPVVIARPWATADWYKDGRRRAETRHSVDD